jgi:hypothetical protein
MVGILISLALICALSWFLLAKNWEGIIYQNGKSIDIGNYHSLEECRADVEKTGGWCGKNCKDYGGGSIANCDPNLPIPKK